MDGNYDFFEKMKLPQEMVTFWATFCFSKYFYIFALISSFKVGFYEGIFRFQKWFYVDVFYFQSEL